MRALTRSVALLLVAAAAAAQRAPVKLPSRPALPPAKPFVYPSYALDSLPNGLQFAVIENHELPLVIVETAFAGSGPLGSSLLDADKPGSWGLMLSMLREGTATRSLPNISDEALDLGAQFRVPATPSFIPPWFRAPKSTWRPALALLADLVMNPTFADASFQRVKTQVSTALDRLPPATLANRILFTQLYNGEGPYRQFATSATLASITRDDVVQLHGKYVRPQNTVIVIAGDVTPTEAREAMRATFGSWARGGTTVAPIIPAPPTTPAPTTIYLKDSPGLPQSLIVTGLLVPGPESRDAAAIGAMTTVLGDFKVSSGSRIYTALRTERGLSYSASVQQLGRPVGEMGVLAAIAAVAPGVTDTAVTTMVKVFKDLRQERPVTAAELEFSKRSLLGSLPAVMEPVQAVADTMLASIRDRLPPDYMNTRVERIGSVTLPEVQAAAAKYLDSDHLAIVIIADRAKVEAALKATGIPVVIVP
jgi:zinc protease